MGGHALKKINTIRKNKIEFNEIEKKVFNLFFSFGIIIDLIPQLYDKETFGDLDILWSFKNNPNIIMKDIIIQLFNPKEILLNGDIISFDFDNFQIDMIQCENIEFAKFFFSYSDFGSIFGKLIKKYDMTFGHNSFILKFNNYPLILTTNVHEFCKFVEIDYNQWQLIKTKEDLFEFIITSRFYKQCIFSSGNYHDRKRSKRRPIYIEFLKYINIDNVHQIDNNQICEKDKEKIFNEALSFFHKNEELENIHKSIEKTQIIHNKFNGNMLKEMGYNGLQIGEIFKKIKNNYPDFDEWIYQTNKEDIMIAISKYIDF
jgi:hypothetical protein